MFKIIRSKRFQIIYLPMFLFILAFLVRSIKAGFFPLFHDEITTVVSSSSLEKALEYSRDDVLPPFLYVINTIFNLASKGNIYFQRLPMIFCGALSIALFYNILRFFKYRWPFIFSLIPLSSFILIYYSQDLRPYSYLVFFTLVTFYYGFKVFVQEEFKIYEILFLAIAFAILPIVHYFSLFHLLALDFSLFIIILVWGSKKLEKILNLVLINLFSLIILIPWADNFSKNLLQSTIPPLPNTIYYFFDLNLVQNLLYKFSGGGDLWSIFLAFLFLASIVLFLYQFSKKLKQKSLTLTDKFIAFLLIYLIIYLFGISRLSFSRFLFWRYFLPLIWPFYLIIFSGFSNLLDLLRFKKAGLLIVSGLVGLILVSNLIDTTCYLLAPNRFSDWRSLAEFTEKLIKEKDKKKILMENLANNEDLKFYLKDKSIEVENMHNVWQFNEEIKKNKADNLIYIQLEEGESEIKKEAEKNFKNKKIFWQSKYLDFLDRRKINPFWYFPIQYGRYTKPVIFY